MSSIEQTIRMIVRQELERADKQRDSNLQPKVAVAVPQEPPQVDLLTIEDAQKRLGIGRTTVFNLIETGQLRTVTIGRSRRIHREDLDSYVAELRR